MGKLWNMQKKFIMDGKKERNMVAWNNKGEYAAHIELFGITINRTRRLIEELPEHRRAPRRVNWDKELIEDVEVIEHRNNP